MPQSSAQTSDETIYKVHCKFFVEGTDRVVEETDRVFQNIDDVDVFIGSSKYIAHLYDFSFEYILYVSQSIDWKEFQDELVQG